MASMATPTGETGDISQILIDTKPDSEWLIEIDILLKVGKPFSRQCMVMLSKKDSKSEKQHASFLIPWGPGHRDNAWEKCNCNYCSSCQSDGGRLIAQIDHDRSLLEDRVTLYVGQDTIAIELPRVFLTQYSKMFQAAFGENRQAQFAEAATKQMFLPEEDPRDFMVLLRLLIHQPQSFAQLNQPHWPYLCSQDADDYCCNCGLDNNILRSGYVAPPLFRICAMLERLAFDLPGSLFETVLNETPTGPGSLVSPTVIDWAMSNSLENGYLQRYAARVLVAILKTDLTTIEPYNAVIEKYPQLALALVQGLYKKPGWYQYKWSPEDEAWGYYYDEGAAW